MAPGSAGAGATSAPGVCEVTKLVLVTIVDGLPQEQIVKSYDQRADGS